MKKGSHRLKVPRDVELTILRRDESPHADRGSSLGTRQRVDQSRRANGARGNERNDGARPKRVLGVEHRLNLGALGVTLEAALTRPRSTLRNEPRGLVVGVGGLAAARDR